MKKWSEIKNQPITWGGYAKLCGVSMIVTVVYCLGGYAYYKHQEKALDKFTPDFNEEN